MQLRIFSAFVIYLGSYLPLSVILFAQDLDAKRFALRLCTDLRSFPTRCELPLTHPVTASIVVLTCFICFALTLFVLSNTRVTQPIQIRESKHIPADLMNYILPYIVAFMTLSYDDVPKLVGFVVFFVWIFVITQKSGRVMVNPVLTVLGWRLYEIKYNFVGVEKGHSAAVLSCVELSPGLTYRQTSIEDIMVIKAES